MPSDSQALHAFVADLERVVDRLRSMSPERLARPFPGYVSRHEAGLSLAQRLADLGQGVEERVAEQPPEPRVVPRLLAHAVSDQVAVTGHDLAAALSGLDADTPVWIAEPGAPEAVRRPASVALAAAHAAVNDLRLSL